MSSTDEQSSEEDAQALEPEAQGSAAGTGDDPLVGEAGEPPHRPGEALVLLAVSLLLFAGGHGLSKTSVSALVEVAPALCVLAWIVPAYWVLARRKRDPFRVHGLFVRPRGVLLGGLISLLILGLYVGAVALWAGGAPKHAIPWAAALSLFAHDLVFVALPEEYFFRGVLQPSLDRAPRVRVLGARVGLGVVLAAALFALCHLALAPDPRRLLVFFPALWFGWLKERTGSVVPGVIAHALANAVELACYQGWLA